MDKEKFAKKTGLFVVVIIALYMLNLAYIGACINASVPTTRTGKVVFYSIGCGVWGYYTEIVMQMGETTDVHLTEITISGIHNFELYHTYHISYTKNAWHAFKDVVSITKIS